MMEFIKQPMAIERRSMELIAPYIEGLSLSEAEKKVYSRIIHAAGDVEYAPIIRISETAVEEGIAALRGGADIYTDVEMVRTGINKRKLASFGGAVHCRIQDPEIAAQAKAQGVTRSLAAMRSFGAALTGSVVAIGNAPTALFEVLRLVREEGVRPASCPTSRSRARRAAVRLPLQLSTRCSMRSTTAAIDFSCVRCTRCTSR